MFCLGYRTGRKKGNKESFLSEEWLNRYNSADHLGNKRTKVCKLMNVMEKGAAEGMIAHCLL